MIVSTKLSLSVRLTYPHLRKLLPFWLRCCWSTVLCGGVRVGSQMWSSLLTFSFLVRSSSVSSASGQGSRAGNPSWTSVSRKQILSGILLSGGHRRVASGGRMIDMIPATPISVSDRIVREIEALEQKLEGKLRDRKQIGQIYRTIANANTGGLDPNISLKTRNIDFPWRRGTRIGQGGAGVAFRAINCSNGSIVCMKEILLSSISSRSLPKSYMSNLRLIADEIDMIMTIAHPNIVRYFGIERYKVANETNAWTVSTHGTFFLILANNLHLYGILFVNSERISQRYSSLSDTCRYETENK